MKSQSFYAKRVQPIVFMAVVTIICILITAALHLYTFDRVQANEQYFLWRSILDAAAVEHDPDPVAVTTLFNEIVTTKETQYTVKASDGSLKYVVERTGAGLWGPITIMIGFNEDLKSLAGVSIVSQTETPGLGARIEEPWFTAQFKGREGPFRLVEEGTASLDDEIDSITGATRTSEAFRNIMNNTIAQSDSIERGL